MNHIHAYWVEKNNFGDLLTPLIVRHLSGREPVRVEPNAPVEHFFVVGSTLHFATPLTTVWGDPAAFVREIFPPAPAKTAKWCFVPHFRYPQFRVPRPCQLVSSAATEAPLRSRSSGGVQETS